MARAKAGALVQNISGTIGGVQFAQQGARIILKKALQKTDPNTFAQQVQRYRMYDAPKQWNALTEAEQLQWATAAAEIRLKSTAAAEKNLSGRMLFMQQLLLSNGAQVDPAPGVPLRLGRPFWITCTPTYAAGAFTVTYAKAPDANTGKYYIRALRSYSYGGIRRRNYNWIESGDYGASGTLNITASYADRYGVPEVGEWISLMIRTREDNGLWSLPFRWDGKRIS